MEQMKLVRPQKQGNFPRTGFDRISHLDEYSTGGLSVLGTTTWPNNPAVEKSRKKSTNLHRSVMVPFEMDRVVVISVAQILCPVARIVRLNVATIKKKCWIHSNTRQQTATE